MFNYNLSTDISDQIRFSILLLFVCLLSSCNRSQITTPLFDGESLQGWEGNQDFFRVENEAIVAGSLDKLIPQNEFLCTTKEYADFDLRLKAKLVGKGDNGGVQFRSKRIHNSSEVSGYQADIGFIPAAWVKNFDEFKGKVSSLADDTPYPLWGSLYDESRRAKVLALGEYNDISEALKKEDWNELRVRAEGNHIKIWVNNQLITAYTENENMPQKGVIGLQVHSGPPLEVWYKDIVIQEL
ncbi:hypothetical protein OKW21_002312 [Catalinimonas alkaloidigena]|uniref:3-keto-disaccharide hydrolase n=1 Tax=Catalinimonas alkaloidigena TaxID=1075417 RepID=UPI002406E142|nr:DUF1080 domain-containing protein [Catalinimonas alkaloidigena]MDF9797049.1 hypothetical protein [Catalinimonas alkaloidigena]